MLKITIDESRCSSRLLPPSNLRVMLFDLESGGHHPNYVRHLVTYWCDKQMSGNLFVVVSPDFVKKHNDVMALGKSSVQFVSISPDEFSRLKRAKKAIKRAFLEWEIHCKYAESLCINHSLIMYFDLMQIAIVLGRSSPCLFSGIYFRPTFHYKYFEDYVPTFQDTWRSWRQKLLLSLALDNRKLAGLLSLDYYAVPYIREISPKDKCIKHLPDPVSVLSVPPKQLNVLRHKLGVEKERKIFLLFGRLSERKGIYQVLEAIGMLSSEVSQKLSLLLIGEIPSSIKSKVLDRISHAQRHQSLQIIIRDSYLSETEVPSYISLADVILAPYQQHVGMSGVLMLSAAYGKPIISSNYGLLGKLTNTYKLGISIDSSSPKSISQAISIFFYDQKDNSMDVDFVEMTNFCSQYTPESFSYNVFSLITNVFETH